MKNLFSFNFSFVGRIYVLSTKVTHFKVRVNPEDSISIQRFSLVKKENSLFFSKINSNFFSFFLPLTKTQLDLGIFRRIKKENEAT